MDLFADIFVFSDIQRFPVIICFLPCCIDYFSSSAELSTHIDLIAQGPHKAYSPAHWPTMITHKPKEIQHKAAWLPPRRGLLPHNMDGTDRTGVFEVTQDPTLYQPTKASLSLQQSPSIKHLFP